jgi:hypothetical protein
LDGVVAVADEDGATHTLGATLAGTLFVRCAPEDGWLLGNLKLPEKSPSSAQLGWGRVFGGPGVSA